MHHLGEIRRFIEMGIFDGWVLRNLFLEQQFHALDVLIGMETLYHHSHPTGSYRPPAGSCPGDVPCRIARWHGAWPAGRRVLV